MTKKTNFLRRSIFGAALLLAGALTLGSCSKDNNSTRESVYVLSGTADGSQMVPAVPGTGTATFSGTYDPNTGGISFTTTWTGLTGAPSFGSIYASDNGEGGVAYGNPFHFGDNLTSTGTTTGSYSLTGMDAIQLIGGGWYFTYSTAANPNGEVRGLIKATR